MGIKTSEILDLVSESVSDGSPFYDGSQSFETEFTILFNQTLIINTGIKPDYDIYQGLWTLHVETQCMNSFANVSDNGFLRFTIKWGTTNFPGPPTPPKPLPAACRTLCGLS